jgi:hypothetical protein
MRRLILALAISLFAVTSTYSATITTFTGASTTVTDGGGSTSISGSHVIVFPNLTITGIGQPFFGPVNFTNGNLRIDTTGQPAGFGLASPGSVSFTVPAGSYGPFGVTAGGVVTFNVINPIEIENSGATAVNFGSLVDSTPELALASNGSGLDFGPIGQLFHLQFSAQGLQYSGGPGGTFSNAPAGTLASGSFSALAVNVGVPEPSTFAIAGAMLGMAGFGFFWQRRSAKLVPVAA